MSDKYEEFKEFVREKYFPNPSRWGGIFNDFEEQCAKKEKENEIKKIITEIIVRTPLKKVPKYKTSADIDIYCSDEVTDKIYNALKEKDLIK